MPLGRTSGLAHPVPREPGPLLQVHPICIPQVESLQDVAHSLGRCLALASAPPEGFTATATLRVPTAAQFFETLRCTLEAVRMAHSPGGLESRAEGPASHSNEILKHSWSDEFASLHGSFFVHSSVRLCFLFTLLPQSESTAADENPSDESLRLMVNQSFGLCLTRGSFRTLALTGSIARVISAEEASGNVCRL